MLKDTKKLLKNKTNFKKGLRQTDTMYALSLKNPEQLTDIEKYNLKILKQTWIELKEKYGEGWELWAFLYITIWNITGLTLFYKTYGKNLKLNSKEELKEIINNILIEMLEIAREINNT